MWYFSLRYNQAFDLELLLRTAHLTTRSGNFFALGDNARGSGFGQFKRFSMSLDRFQETLFADTQHDSTRQARRISRTMTTRSSKVGNFVVQRPTALACPEATAVTSRSRLQSKHAIYSPLCASLNLRNLLAFSWRESQIRDKCNDKPFSHEAIPIPHLGDPIN